MSEHPLKITFNPKSVAIFLGMVVMLLVLAHLGANVLHWIAGYDITRKLEIFLHLDAEKNMPTFFTLCLWMLNAVLFLLVWKIQRFHHRRQAIWLMLSVLFLFLAIDELSSIHERLVPVIRSTLSTSGVFYFAWVIPYGIGVIVLAIFLMPTIWKLNSKVRFWFGVSATTFITGSIGLEMLGGWHVEKINEQRDIIYFCISTMEETLEMTGLVMLVYTLLLIVQHQSGGFLVQVSDMGNQSQSDNKPVNEKI